MITESEYDCGMLKDMLDWSEQIKKRQTCGMNNIDCGKAGYKTDREIELEKKLEIAISALEDIGYCKSRIMLNYPERLVHWALDALAKIKENKR